MADLPRLNGIIKALEAGSVAFIGSGPADGAAGTTAPYDGTLFEMEHAPYDIQALQTGLQGMLDRRQIAQQGLAPAVTPIVRIPPNQGQSNWVAKQVLDIGVYGIIWPHVDTVEDAYNAVAAMRYPRPQPAPLVPDWDLYTEPGYKQIIFAHVPCNWFQCQENSIDPVHFEWLHSNWSQVLKGGSEPTYVPTHLKLGFDEFEYGFVYRRVRADTDEDNDLWTVGRVCLWPNALYTTFFEWRVPIDDEN